MPKSGIPWGLIKTEYLRGATQKYLSKIYNISERQIRRHLKENSWELERKTLVKPSDLFIENNTEPVLTIADIKKIGADNKNISIDIIDTNGIEKADIKSPPTQKANRNSVVENDSSEKIADKIIYNILSKVLSQSTRLNNLDDTKSIVGSFEKLYTTLRLALDKSTKNVAGIIRSDSEEIPIDLTKLSPEDIELIDKIIDRDK